MINNIFDFLITFRDFLNTHILFAIGSLIHPYIYGSDHCPISVTIDS